MITRLTKHDGHQVSVHLTRPGCKHYAALRCVKCNKHIQWLSQEDAKKLSASGVDYYITKDNI
jgi:hypothetical protein